MSELYAVFAENGSRRLILSGSGVLGGGSQSGPREHRDLTNCQPNRDRTLPFHRCHPCWRATGRPVRHRKSGRTTERHTKEPRYPQAMPGFSSAPQNCPAVSRDAVYRPTGSHSCGVACRCWRTWRLDPDRCRCRRGRRDTALAYRSRASQKRPSGPQCPRTGCRAPWQVIK
jgi:hypothetical protein